MHGWELRDSDIAASDYGWLSRKLDRETYIICMHAWLGRDRGFVTFQL